MTSLRDKLAAGEAVFSGWSSLPDALTVEALAGTAFDAVTLDMQHGGHHEDSVLRAILPIGVRGKHPLVRIPVGRFDMASRALDFGTEAIIAPMVNSVGDAEAFARAVKYPPTGLRSWGPSFAMPRKGAGDEKAWLRSQNEATLAFAMIETRQALEALDGILDVDGIDGVFVGPSDFSIAWSDGSTVDPSLPEMMDAIATIAERASNAGKLSGIYVVDPALVARYRAMGFTLFASGSEARYMSLGVKALLDAARS